MKTLTLVCSALILGLNAIPVPSQAREGGYGGFTDENIQAFRNYINSQDMIKVQTGEELDRAIDSIPINLEAAIDLEQERGLRDWLRQYLIAFSESGNDSLAAVFYLREGFDEERYKKVKIEWIKADATLNGSVGTEIESLVEKARASIETTLMEKGPISLFRSDHRRTLSNINKRLSINKKYFIENVSFHDSEFRVFELNKEDQTFFRMAEDRGMLPMGYSKHYPSLGAQLPILLEAGERIICADILFIVEEPSESAFNPTTPGRTPSFFRLMWDRDKKLWCHLEIFYSPGVAEAYLFALI